MKYSSHNLDELKELFVKGESEDYDIKDDLYDGVDEYIAGRVDWIHIYDSKNIYAGACAKPLKEKVFGIWDDNNYGGIVENYNLYGLMIDKSKDIIADQTAKMVQQDALDIDVDNIWLPLPIKEEYRDKSKTLTKIIRSNGSISSGWVDALNIYYNKSNNNWRIYIAFEEDGQQYSKCISVKDLFKFNLDILDEDKLKQLSEIVQKVLIEIWS